MARISGIEPAQAGWFTRIVYWIAERKVATLTGKSRLVEPLKITAHHPQLLKATARMEMGQESAQTVSADLKALAALQTAQRIGCPF